MQKINGKFKQIRVNKLALKSLINIVTQFQNNSYKGKIYDKVTNMK